MQDFVHQQYDSEIEGSRWRVRIEGSLKPKPPKPHQREPRQPSYFLTNARDPSKDIKALEHCKTLEVGKP